MTPEQKQNFERLLRPRQIAFVGGADAIVAIGEARRRGYAGGIWPVNPRRSEMAGLPCFASLEDLPCSFPLAHATKISLQHLTRL